MTARHRAARAQLRHTHQQDHSTALSLDELRAANLALSAANSTIHAGLHAQMVGPAEIYELLTSVFDRLDRAIADVEMAIIRNGGDV